MPLTPQQNAKNSHAQHPTTQRSNTRPTTKALLEADWKANPANAGKTPGPALYSSWDYIAWNGTAELEFIDEQLIPRPAKEVQDPETLEQRWRVQLAEAGYQSPRTSAQLRVAGWPPM